MNRKLAIIAVGVIAAISVASRWALADDKPIPKEVQDMVGTYTGDWTWYSYDTTKNEAVKARTWSDVVKAENPVIEGDRAFVSLTNKFNFPDGTSFEVKGKEGYMLKKDGSLGDNFIEVFGPPRFLVKISEGVSSYVTPADPQELVRFGFPQGTTGQQVAIISKAKEAGVEVHRISRVTNASWKDADGKEHWAHFLSLQGYHKKQ